MPDSTTAGPEDPPPQSTSSAAEPQLPPITGDIPSTVDSSTSASPETAPLAYGHGKARRIVIRGRIINGSDTDQPE